MSLRVRLGLLLESDAPEMHMLNVVNLVHMTIGIVWLTR